MIQLEMSEEAPVGSSSMEQTAGRDEARRDSVNIIVIMGQAIFRVHCTWTKSLLLFRQRRFFKKTLQPARYRCRYCLWSLLLPGIGSKSSR